MFKEEDLILRQHESQLEWCHILKENQNEIHAYCLVCRKYNINHEKSTKHQEKVARYRKDLINLISIGSGIPNDYFSHPLTELQFQSLLYRLFNTVETEHLLRQVIMMPIFFSSKKRLIDVIGERIDFKENRLGEKSRRDSRGSWCSRSTTKKARSPSAQVRESLPKLEAAPEDKRFVKCTLGTTLTDNLEIYERPEKMSWSVESLRSLSTEPPKRKRSTSGRVRKRSKTRNSSEELVVRRYSNFSSESPKLHETQFSEERDEKKNKNPCVSPPPYSSLKNDSIDKQSEEEIIDELHKDRIREATSRCSKEIQRCTGEDEMEVTKRLEKELPRDFPRCYTSYNGQLPFAAGNDELLVLEQKRAYYEKMLLELQIEKQKPKLDFNNPFTNLKWNKHKTWELADPYWQESLVDLRREETRQRRFEEYAKNVIRYSVCGAEDQAELRTFANEHFVFREVHTVSLPRDVKDFCEAEGNYVMEDFLFLSPGDVVAIFPHVDPKGHKYLEFCLTVVEEIPETGYIFKNRLTPVGFRSNNVNENLLQDIFELKKSQELPQAYHEKLLDCGEILCETERFLENEIRRLESD